ncbi:hypothetical protein [Cerasicoccus frondis]|uniref:hypothetical protein n=1 Tax=Cerasicoccus frondis TaxID=490090 RepID=UPI002852532C|nr:hypothetical protein [Cerasicoccus frondis]
MRALRYLALISVAILANAGIALSVEKSEKQSSLDNDTINIRYKDEDVRIILYDVANLYNLEVQIPDDFNGRASIYMQNAHWYQVFNALTSGSGFTYRENGKVIQIVRIQHPWLSKLSPTTGWIVLGLFALSLLLNAFLLVRRSDTN